MKKIKLILFLIIIIKTGFAQLVDQGIVINLEQKAKSAKMFFEVDGIVSMEAEHASYINGWKPARMAMDTDAMEADSAFAWKGGVMRFDIEFKQPGKYALWVLARKGRRGQYNCNDIKVWLDRDYSKVLNPFTPDRNGLTGGLLFAEDYQTTPDPKLNPKGWESELNIPTTNFIWSSNPKEGKGPAYWKVDKPGLHHIEFVIGEEWQYAIDKVVLSLNNQNPPTGRGPAETIAENIRPLKSGLDPDIILPPAWAFGILYGGYTNQQESMERVKAIIDHDYPIDGYFVDSWFWDFTGGGLGPKGYINFRGDSVAFPEPKKMWDYFQDNHVKAGIWIWDIIQKDGNEKVFEDFEKAGAFERVFKNTNGWHNEPKQSLAGQINFNDPLATEHFQKNLKPLFDQGLDFLKLDRGPDVPFAKGVFEAIQQYGKETKGRGFILQHVGSLSDPEFKKYPTKWSGDSEIAWDLPEYPNFINYTKGGLKQNIEMVAWPNKYEYEVPFLTHDGGGFRIIGCKDFGEELFMRWIQFSLFNPVTEIFQSLFNSHENLAWQFSPRAHNMFVELSHLKMRLFPYIYSYAHLTRQTGKKMIQGDGIHRHQYLFGNELLVGPVVEKGSTTKEMHFPEGKWLDFWTGREYIGGMSVAVDAPLTKIPLFVKSGAIIPMREYARSIEIGNNNLMTICIFPDGESSFTMYEDDGMSNDYINGGFSTTLITCKKQSNSINITIHPIHGEFSGKPDSREWLIQINNQMRPTLVVLNGQKVNTKDFLYDSAKRLLEVTAKSRTNSKNVLTISY